ncbi:MAG: META domain-containing protein, partial [Pontibacter sp.]|nr:META domain-containing protein [Pontibacter sp.]
QVWQEKFDRGLDFVAMGSEPSWSLEFDLEKTLSFTAMGAQQTTVTMPVPEPVMLQSPDGVVYSANTEAGQLRVEMRKISCTDQMAGNRFPYSVSVTANGRTFEGCGMYLYDQKLSGKWVLQELNGKTINADALPRGIPTLVIYPEQGKVHGSGGCNRINGAIEIKGDKITFNQMAVTRMACPNMLVEDEFLRLLSGNKLLYQVQNGQLMLQMDGRTVMVFKREVY